MKFYLEMNLLLALSFVCFWPFQRIALKKGKLFLQKQLVRLLLGVLSLPLVFDFVAGFTQFNLVEKRHIDSERVQSAAQVATMPMEMVSNTVTRVYGEFKEHKSQNLAWPIVLLFLFWPVWLSIQMFKLERRLKKAILFKDYPKLRILIDEGLTTPITYRRPKKNIVVLPLSLFINKKYLKHALAHELQHIRQGDTLSVYFLEVLRSLFFVNPFIHFWIRSILEGQEILCDKEVIRRKRILTKEYASTLIDVLSKQKQSVPLGTLAMASFTQVKRRILILKKTNQKVSSTHQYFFILLLAGLSWQVLGVSKNSWRKSLDYQQASQLIQSMKTEIPIEINDRVLYWLNFFLSNQRGRAHMIKALQRLHAYRPNLEHLLDQSGMPLELLAVPLVESGYRNHVVSTMKAGGIWQFIPSTARRYGLTVTKKRDERFNVHRLTEAAIAYYRHLVSIDEFQGDWRLALLAYNAGESAVKKAIRKTGQTDPWAFKKVGDKDYLAKVMAAIIILKAPRNHIFPGPVKYRKKTSSFGMRRDPVSRPRFHKGVDLAAPYGQSVLSPLPGVVKAIETHPLKGKTVEIDHGNQIMTRYYHLSQQEVAVGQVVQSGQIIALVGSSGRSTGPHLHYEVVINGKNIDPEIFL